MNFPYFPFRLEFFNAGNPILGNDIHRKAVVRVFPVLKIMLLIW